MQKVKPRTQEPRITVSYFQKGPAQETSTMGLTISELLVTLVCPLAPVPLFDQEYLL